MKAIVLEVLRDGPPHNQLLSPLTKYLALCGEHPATALQVPFEHAQWLARLGGLTYRDSEETRQLQLAELSSSMGALMNQIPGLVAELTKSRALQPDPDARSGPMVHLRLVLNANELALLPLELSGAPHGFPAAGQPLVMQTEIPMSVTREVRRAAEVLVEWDRPPKILFADPSTCTPRVFRQPRRERAVRTASLGAATSNRTEGLLVGTCYRR